MKTSESIKEIAAALAEFQKDMPALTKNSNVSMELKSGRKVEYDYIELGELVKQSKDVLSKHGLSILQPRSTINDKPVLITMLMHKSGEYIQTHSVLDLSGKSEQEKGSAITYNSRYDYVGMLRLGLLGEDDDGQAASKIDTDTKDPGNFKITIGKYEGKMIKDLTIQQIEAGIKYWLGVVEETRSPLVGNPKAFVENGQKYLEQVKKEKK